MARFQFEATPLPGLLLVHRDALVDARGFLSRLFCADEFAGAGWRQPIAQINHTLTRSPGTVRGLHFQFPPHAEAKLVTCVRGSVFDVAVDVRRDSPTWLHWHGAILSASNQCSFLIPEGFAHGFQALQGDCEMIYLHSAPYSQDAEGALNALDPRLSITWPLPVGERSDRDVAHPFIDATFKGVGA